MIICKIDGCNKEAHYAIFQMRDDFTKRWIDVCDKHDLEIERQNTIFLRLFQGKMWKEVK